MKKAIALLLFTLGFFTYSFAQNQAVKSDSYRMNTFIDALMKKMTLDEKIGQLNLPGSGDIVTGQAGNSDIAKKIKEGEVGGLIQYKNSCENTCRSKDCCGTKPFKNSHDIWYGCYSWI